MPNFELQEREASYPAAVALVQIGSPALPSILRVVTDIEDNRTRQLAAWAISKILGRELAVAYLQQQGARHKGQAALRIKAALDGL